MKHPILFSSVLISALSLTSPLALAEDAATPTGQVKAEQSAGQLTPEQQKQKLDKERARQQQQAQSRQESLNKQQSQYKDKVANPAKGEAYGSSLMTKEERKAFSTRMKSASSNAEREQIQREHHEEMTRRAQERGVKLPEQPPAKTGKGQKKGWDDTGAPGKSGSKGQGKSQGGGSGKPAN